MYSLKYIRFQSGGFEMLNRWWCMDCLSAVELDRHCRCASCESEAVDSCGPVKGNSLRIPIAGMAATASISCS